MSTLENAALLGLVALVPLVALTLTSFVKVSVVLSLVRNALGTPDAPSGLVVTGLSLVLTFFVMAPVAIEMVQVAGTPAPTAPAPTPRAPDPPAPPASQPAVTQPTQPAPTLDVVVHALVPAHYQGHVAAADRALGPLRGFLVKHTREADRETFRGLAAQLGSSVRGDEIWVLAPAFIATELREAFLIAILIFVPFLVIDLVVALSLAALGLQTSSPQTIALPLKLVLFVAVDGWRLLLDGLLRGYV